MSMRRSTGKKTKPPARVLSAQLTPRELAEYRARVQLCQHYQATLDIVRHDFAAYQRQLQQAYSLPAEFTINLATGEVQWPMTRLEAFHATQGEANGR